MRDVAFYSNLGLGDHMIMNALVRNLSFGRKIVVFAKHGNLESVKFQWRDFCDIAVFGVADDEDAKEACAMLERNGAEVMRNGLHMKDWKFDMKTWDREFYRQCGVDFETSWSHFKVDRVPTRELVVIDSSPMPVFNPDLKHEWIKQPYAFVHDDPERGFLIKKTLLPKKMRIIKSKAMRGAYDGPPNIFDWCGIIENATELHLMESSFAILADRLPELKAKRLCVHTYCRKSIPPKYRRQWEMIK